MMEGFGYSLPLTGLPARARRHGEERSGASGQWLRYDKLLELLGRVDAQIALRAMAALKTAQMEYQSPEQKQERVHL